MLTLGCSGETYPDDVSVTPISTNAPIIIRAPGAQTAVASDNAALVVTATGATPLSYQWRFLGANLSDNVRILGSQSNTLTIQNVSANDSGIYSIIVSNAFGSVTGSVASLIVLGTNLLVNGGFESPAISSDSIFAVTPDGWTSEGDVLIVNGIIAAGRYLMSPHVEGQQCVNILDPNNTGTPTAIWQSVLIPSNGLYNLEWFDAFLTGLGPGTFPENAYGIGVTDSQGNIVWTNSYGNLHGTNWQRRSIQASLNSGTYTLAFTRIYDGGFSSIVFDDVSLRAVVLPSFAAQPPLMSSPQALAGNQVSVVFSSPINSVYDVLFSTNLVNWNFLTTITNATGNDTITLPAANPTADYYQLRGH